MKVVGKVGRAVIIEYERDGLVKRCKLPKEVVRNHRGTVPDHVIDRGIEVGLELEDAFDQLEMPTSTELLDYVRRAGMWTHEDVLGNISLFKRLLVDALSDQIGELLKEMR